MTSTTNPADLAASQPPPAHHVHQSNDRLPTHPKESYLDGAAADLDNSTGDDPTKDVKHNAFNEERPLGTQSASEGDAARGGAQDGLPEGKASITDMLVGKTEKVAGKLKKDPKLHEKGELREAGGKAAVTGEVRASHD